MQKEILTKEAPVIFDGYTLTPVVKLLVTCIGYKDRFTYYVSKQPVYLLVSLHERTKAFTPDGCEIPVELVEAALSRYEINQKAS